MLSADQADPQGLLRAALQDNHGHSAREILLAWLMSLAPLTDPALAARRMLPASLHVPGSLGGELAEIARWPAARLGSFAQGRRRRST